jgi:sulfatase maturation enzyme AslB (radical SAM superfamily)
MVKDNGDYENALKTRNIYYNLYEKDFKDRLRFAQSKGCDTIILTGNAEPQQNREFLRNFGSINQSLARPYSKIELQTTGVLLDGDYLYWLRNHVGVTTISLSISSLNESNNEYYIGKKESVKLLPLEKLTKEIKLRRFNLRLSLNLTSDFEDVEPEKIFERAKELNADQITFRVLYKSGNRSKADRWVEKYKASEYDVKNIEKYIRENGRELEKLDFGYTKYSVHEIGTVLDDDCMSSEAKEDIKYYILRPNCKLYTKWDDKGSLIY